VKKYSSGESSDAGKWFENSNNRGEQREGFDNDPPFFLRNSSSSSTPPEGIDPLSIPPYPRQAAIPYRSGGLTTLSREGSSTEDFRSVIDDLTVANKRLKQKLRKYEKLYDAHLQDEKLFEVRFHGLPDDKKKELEETLRKFAAGLEDTPSSDYPSTADAPRLKQMGTTSSLTSRFAESGYASLATSGQNSLSAPSAQLSDTRKMCKTTFDRQQSNVQSYLHEMSAGLLPKHSPPLSEKSKKRLVVRRLEQIFAGKRPGPWIHQQPIQQEEVAQSAAIADREARQASGKGSRLEGMREARIMPVPSEEYAVVSEAPEPSVIPPQPATIEQGTSGSGSPDQRPTRPLDLDPYRAQVPSENMEYIRHLGFTPPDMASEESPLDGHGWIYLNLLINMAQLHTINVTPDFVKEAVSEYSSKFELSHDGRKIRWRGGQEVTRTTSDSSSEPLSGSSPYDDLNNPGMSPRKRLQMGGSGSTEDPLSMERHARRVARAAKDADHNKFAYNPIFYHKEESEDGENYYNASSSASPIKNTLRRGSSGLGSSSKRSTYSRKRRDDGPMIFYNKAKFCTDLSGDQQGVSGTNSGTYESFTSQPLGALPKSSSESSVGLLEQKGPFATQPMQLDQIEGSQMSSEEGLRFSPEELGNDSSDYSPETMEFEASGLGGVQPEDHFAIRVRLQQQVRSGMTASASVSAKNRLPRSRFYSSKIAKALEDRKGQKSSHPVISQHIVSASRKDLPSSELPPASFLPFDSTSSGDVDSDLDSDISSSPSLSDSSEKGGSQPVRPLLNTSPMSHTRQPRIQESDADDSDDDDDDESLNFVPAAGRPYHSSAVHHEAHHDPSRADKLAKEIPAGSSAATAGGGSGFNSPHSDDGGSTKQPSVGSRGSAEPRASLKRARTSDHHLAVMPGKAPKLD
jgi:hypothetical protein